MSIVVLCPCDHPIDNHWAGGCRLCTCKQTWADLTRNTLDNREWERAVQFDADEAAHRVESEGLFGSTLPGEIIREDTVADRIERARDVIPQHYRAENPESTLQPWDVVDAFGLDFYLGNVIKYVCRAGKKGPAIPDLKKAKHYIERAIERAEDEGE